MLLSCRVRSLDRAQLSESSTLHGTNGVHLVLFDRRLVWSGDSKGTYLVPWWGQLEDWAQLTCFLFLCSLRVYF